MEKFHMMLNKSRIKLSPYIIILLITGFLIGYISSWFISKFIKLALWKGAITSKYSSMSPGYSTNVTQSYIIHKLSAKDEFTLIDIPNFKFTINHNMCKKEIPFLLILIHSAPANVRKRNVIRETWGGQIASTVILFLVGISEKYKVKLEEEDHMYKDLIQGNFLDTYRNITYKHVMALKWVTYHCPNVSYVLKADDDVYVNISALLKFLHQDISSKGIRGVMLCDAISTSKVKRSWRSKWHVTPKEYPGQQYPPYCAGWAVLYSVDAAVLLYREAQKEPFFWIDDVHITGTIAKKTNLTHIPLRSMILSKHELKALLEKASFRKDFLFGPPDLKENKIRALHNAVAA